MMYQAQVKEMFFFDFVFYEVKGNTMYVYCPNCGHTHEITLDKHRKAMDVIRAGKLFIQCQCFKSMRYGPSFYKSSDDYYYHQRKEVGAFRNDNGEAVLDVYWYYVSFSKKHNQADTLRRRPQFEQKKAIEIRFKKDGKMSYHTAVSPCTTNWHYLIEWYEAKSWHHNFEFKIIKQSLENLKGTALESYIQDVPRMVKVIKTVKIIRSYELNEWIAGMFMRLHTNNAFRKLWKAGFDTLCFEDMKYKLYQSSSRYSYYHQTESSYGIISWSSRKLERILKTQLSKIDKVAERKTLHIEELENIQRFAKYEAQNVEFTSDNLKIASASTFARIADVYAKLNVPITKAFKYLRGTMKGHGSTVFVSDYNDYLNDLKYLKVKMTPDVLFPRDLDAAHNRYATLRRQVWEEQEHAQRKKELEAKSKSFAQAIEPYKVLDYKEGDFEVKVIRSTKALLAEATALHNCSVGYVDRIINGTSILFAVKKVAHPRTPYCMLEYSPKKMQVVQNRCKQGSGCSIPEQAEQDFVQSWLQNIVIPTMRKQARAG